MKKYLMIGAAALMIGASFTSCSKEKDLYDPAGQAERFLQTYADAFIKVFGQPAATQDWGFGSQAQARATRADGSGANTNGGLWCKTYSNIPAVLTQGQKDRVRMYFQQNTFTEPIQQIFNTYFVQQVYKGGTTPYNAQTNPLALSTEKYQAADGRADHVITGGNQMDQLTVGNDHVHVNNFNFADYSNGQYTMEVKDGHTYPDNYTPWTEESAAANNKSWSDAQNENFNNLSKYYDQIMLMENVPTTCFGYWQSNGTLGYDDKYVCIDGKTIDAWADQQSGYTGEAVSGRYFVGFDFEQILDVYYAENGEEKFFEFNGEQYHYLSQQTDKYAGTMQTKNDGELWEEVRVNGQYMGKQLKAETIQGLLDDGYLPVWGKDYREWVKVSRIADHVYSDWIVAITPAKLWNEEEIPEIPEYLDDPDYRIIAEDLTIADKGNDFDFNDVVFDVYYNKKNDSKAKIKLIAAGGTLPLEIRVGGKSYEVHEKFGVATTVMVNTGAGADGYTCEPFEVTIDKNDLAGDDGIKLFVNKGDDTQINFIQLTAETGHVAAKIKVDHTYQWCGERVDIDKVYPNFEKYVKNPENYAPYAGKPTWWAK